MEDGLSYSEFSMRDQEEANTPDPAYIYPFLPDISKVLKSTFAGTKYEKMFAGNFVDRTRLYDGEFPKEPLWDPLNIKQNPSRKKGRSIYCTLVCSINYINELMQLKHHTKNIKFYLTLYQDMMIPLINYIDGLCLKQKKQLDVMGFYDESSIKLLIPEIQCFFKKPSASTVKKILNEKTFNRFDKLLTIQPDLFSDTMLCSAIPGKEAIANELEPSQDLFNKLEIFHDGLLPDVLRHVVNCNFFHESRDKHPLVHLISKSLPQRCTIRNLSDILRSYCKKSDEVYTFVIGCMKASLLGLYKHASVRPPFHIRRILINVFKTYSKIQFLQWMLLNHQQLLFYIIKEFLVFSCKLIPSLYHEICLRYSWDKFEDGVLHAMNKVRKYENFDPENPMQFKLVESDLATENKQQIHHLYRPIKSSFASTVLSECDKIDDESYVTKTHLKISSEWKDLMYQIAIRIKDRHIPFDMLECFHVSEESRSTISQIQEVYMEEGSKTSLNQFLRNLNKNNRAEFETIRDYCDAFDRKMNIRLFYLPVHTYIGQCQALRRKHKIPTEKELPEHCGEVLVCLNCKTFKSFINHHDAKGKPMNLYAYGHSKVLVEHCCDMNGKESLKIFCGKRCDKSDGKKRHNYASNSISGYMDVSEDQLQTQQYERNKKRQCKEMRKDHMNDICSNTEVIKVSLLGRALQFYNKIYTICPSCGNAMAYSGKHFNGEKGFYCGCCLSEGGELFTSICCTFCQAIKNNESWEPIYVADEENEEERRQIYLCKTCKKPWITESNVLLKYSTIRKGLSEKWKRLQHPSNDTV